MLKNIYKTLPLVLLASFLIASSAEAKTNFKTPIKKCLIAHHSGKPNGYFKAQLIGYKTKYFAVVTAIRYGFGPDDYYGNKNNIEVRYKKSKSNLAQPFTWESDDNLAATGAMRPVPKKTNLVIRRKTNIFVKGIADRGRDPDKRCEIDFRL